MSPYRTPARPAPERAEAPPRVPFDERLWVASIPSWLPDFATRAFLVCAVVTAPLGALGAGMAVASAATAIGCLVAWAQHRRQIGRPLL